MLTELMLVQTNTSSVKRQHIVWWSNWLLPITPNILSIKKTQEKCNEQTRSEELGTVRLKGNKLDRLY